MPAQQSLQPEIWDGGFWNTVLVQGLKERFASFKAKDRVQGSRNVLVIKAATGTPSASVGLFLSNYASLFKLSCLTFGNSVW